MNHGTHQLRRQLVLLGLTVLLAFGVVACGGGPVTIQSVGLARDNGGGEAGETVTGFSPGDHILHAVVELNRIETGLKVGLVWIAVEAGGEKNFEIDRTEFTSLAANTIKGKIELPTDWPVGSYRLDIYLNDALARSVDFAVE
jgi:hypothetical protein